MSSGTIEFVESARNALRMRHLFACLCLIACGNSVREVQTPEGERAFAATCEGDGAKCDRMARKECPDGYGVLSESASTRGPHEMVFRCQRNGTPFSSPAAPASASSPSALEAAGAIVSGAARGFDEGLNSSSGSCRSASSCRQGEVCLIPRGQSTGTCNTVR